ncbi:unnamed protein product [Aphanomyces euteiches]|uniref:FAD-binding PCMH-type domain-containing protein n=1 Tax=Aphanomyces euteiches TaxID=100861 RepID=A0A6G0XUH4_9STRA|nr:hypothetical protein Ae201684_001253 [Aphanomyces euteiches]KAH9099256.1 hypothetical protein Ae201684P_018273 [Aphanomyces euteiches]KAH9155766.1 hypothetical protein AeRB84_002295 [Aphanomyces euteiches]
MVQILSTIWCTVLLLPFAAGYCTPSNASCWPSAADVAVLNAELDPSIARNLFWPGGDAPRVTAVPIYSPGDQPLYGQNQNLFPLYTKPDSETAVCFDQNVTTLYCTQSARNNPLSSEPAFVAWPTKPRHVSALVKFASRHNLCVSVAGTGHDFLNRHSCQDTPGVMVRTSLFKEVTVNLKDSRGPGGTIRFGAGVVFSEAHYQASLVKRYIASGWATTVGIVGWSFGGGHGPFAGAAGLGVDNIVEAQVVLANGDLVTVNSKSNPDLWWAIRGGGGSTWGIVTSLTLRLHKIPRGGFTTLEYGGSVDYCNSSKLQAIVDGYLKWTLRLDKKWSGLFYLTPTQTPGRGCGGSVDFFAFYMYTHGSDDNDCGLEDFNRTAAALVFAVNPSPNATTNAWTAKQYNSTWAFVVHKDLEPIVPVTYLPGGLPSVLLNRTVIASGKVTKVLMDQLLQCPQAGKCHRQELYDDLTGHVDSPRPSDVSIAPGFRSAVIHFLSSSWTTTEFGPAYAVGANSYFGESDANVPNWSDRYWGVNYPKLTQIKAKYDPTGRFGCRRCVGSAP